MDHNCLMCGEWISPRTANHICKKSKTAVKDMTTKRWTKKEIVKWCDWRVNGPTSATEYRGIHKSMIAAILKLLRKL